ncbi:hypothetical protein ACOMHN_053962 [Nucella lapillus]
MISITNHFGHCISHSSVLELETDVCNSLLQSNSLLPATILKEDNVTLHFCWDNFDLQEETASGAGTTHSAHGIAIQEVTSGTQVTTHLQELEQQHSSRQRTVDYQPQPLQPCFVNQKVEPKLNIVETSVTNHTSAQYASQADFIWILARYRFSSDQCIPSWAGWVSLTGNNLSMANVQTTVGYMQPVLRPITENDTLQHILQVSVDATKEVKQKTTFFTGDLAVAKKAFMIVWQNQRFQSVVVRLGMFHFLCSYMAALGKLVRGSGLGDVIVQSGICASGSIEAVLAGKHYNRALRVHKVVLESLQRLLLEQFLNESTEATELFQQLSDDLQLCKDRLQLEAILSKPSAVRFFNLYTTFKERIISGEKGSTPQFWLQYAERVWLILRLLRATKENDFDLHLSCLQDMCPLLFAMDYHNYARYATVYFLHMLNLSHNHPDAIQHLRQGGFSVARSSVPACRIPVDQTIEQTINCQAKSKGGIVGFSRNSAAYFRWCMTRHVRASFLAATLEMAGMTGDDVNKVHKDLQPSGTRTSEDNVKRMTESFLSFMNPFSVEEPGLYCLSSGMPAPESVQEALLSADTRGKEAFNIFITERLVNKTLSFHAPLKKVGLKTFASVHKTKTVRASSNKTIQVAAQRDIFGQLMMISQENNINLQKVMCYPLSPIPWSMATPDGMPAKTDKSKLMQLLEKEQVLQDLDRSKCTSIVDGMVLLHSLTALPSTFAELADKVLRCLPASTRVDFVADTYHPDSIKMMERIRRGQSETFLLSGPNTKVPRDWKKFLSNGENKNQLIEFLLSEWMKDCYAEKLLNKQLYVTSGTKCFRLTSMDGKCTQGHPVPELESTQEEADTRIILHCFHQDSSTEPEGIIIRSIDTDVFVLLLHFSSQFNKKVYMDTGTGNHRRMICMSDLAASYDKDFCEALLGIHAFSGCDSTSSFITKGKKTVMKTVSKHKVFQDTFCSLGRQSLSSDTLESLEHFVCCLYNRPKVKYVNQLRFDLLKEKFDTKKGPLLACYNGTDLSLLPPCQCTLQMHIQRVHYQVEVWKSAGEAQPAIDGPAGRGWEITEEGGLEIRWSEEDILPQELVDILCDQQVLEEENEDFELVNLCDAVQEEGCEEGCDTEESTNE